MQRSHVRSPARSWCSLYQKPRTEKYQEQRFREALENISIWYGHELTTVLVLHDQPNLERPREERGWPFFEETICHVTKAMPYSQYYELPSAARIIGREVHSLKLWPKVLHTWPSKRPAGPVQTASSHQRILCTHNPAPMAPSRFEEELSPDGLNWNEVGAEKPMNGNELVNKELAEALERKTTFVPAEWKAFGIQNLASDHFIMSGNKYFQPADKRTFTNGCDKELVLKNYKRDLSTLFGSRECHDFSDHGWATIDLEELCLALSEVDCPKLHTLDLSGNDRVSDLRPLLKDAPAGTRLYCDFLDRLRTLRLGGSQTSPSELTELPSAIRRLHNLEMLEMPYCGKLEALPETIGTLKALRNLNLHGNKSLKALPYSLTKLKLQTLDLSYCEKLEALSILESLPSSMQSLRLVRVPLGEIHLSKLCREGCKGKRGRFPSLESIDLSECDIRTADGEEGVWLAKVTASAHSRSRSPTARSTCSAVARYRPGGRSSVGTA